jgi:hypothetical protein
MPPIRRPSVLGWSRLEPLPATPDLEPGLQAPLGDPLWLLARQWQFGELHGDDAGSPVEVRLSGKAAGLSRYLAGRLNKNAATRAVDFSTLAAPLEPVVEAEPLRAASERLRTEAGLHFLRLLDAAGLSRLRARYVTSYRSHASASPLDPAAEARFRLLGRRVPDGALVAADLEGLARADSTLTGLPPQPRIAAADVDADPLERPAGAELLVRVVAGLRGGHDDAPPLRAAAPASTAPDCTAGVPACARSRSTCSASARRTSAACEW